MEQHNQSGVVINNPSLDLKGVSQPVTKLIEVVAQGIGAVYKPVGTILQSMADAKSNLILANSEVEVSALFQRAAHRIAYTEVERQKNLEAIIERANSVLPEKVSEKPVSKDWISHFFSAAQDVSDEDLHLIWGQILANEVAEPGSTSKRTLEFIKTVSKEEAELFIALLSVSLTTADGWRFLVLNNATTKWFFDHCGGADVERHMLDIGILGADEVLVGLSKTKDWDFSYGTAKYRFIPPPPPEHSENDTIEIPELWLSFRLFTSIGQELSRVAKQEVFDDFIPQLSASLQKEWQVRIELQNPA